MRNARQVDARADKFNPGQKLNAIFVGVSVLVMLVTGQCCSGSGSFPCRGDRGATFVHDVFAWASFSWSLAISSMALTHRDALRSIFKGWVSRSWAERYAARWIQEEPSAN